MRKYTSPTIKKIIAEIDPLQKEQFNQRMNMSVLIGNALESKGISKSDFAEMMDKHPSEVTKWLSGRHNFTIDTLTAIQIKLGIQLLPIDAKALSVNVEEQVTANVIIIATTIQQNDWKNLYRPDMTVLNVPFQALQAKDSNARATA